MNRKALKLMVKSTWRGLVKAARDARQALHAMPATYRYFCVPDECEMCGDQRMVYGRDLRYIPRHSVHPGRGQWLCDGCIYSPIGSPKGDWTLAHTNTPEEALAFRDEPRPIHDTHGDWMGTHQNDSLRGIFAKASRSNADPQAGAQS